MEAMVQRMSATELAVGDIRTTLTAQAQNADSMRTLLEQVAAQINGVMEAHEKIHQEVADVRARGGPSFSATRKVAITPKDLKIEVLGNPSGAGYRQQWPEWSDKAKDYLALRLPDEMDLRSVLTKLESQKEPLTESQLAEYKMDAGSKAELRFFLKNNTTGYPYNQLAGNKDPLEMWRVVAQSCDPLSHEGNFTDSQQLHNPTRCKTYEELPGQLAQWRKSLERLGLQRFSRIQPKMKPY